jgi:hypothetical protein
MIKVTEEIYKILTAVTADTFYHILPADVNESALLVVYELNESGSFDSLDKNNYANTVDLTVKILHPDSMELLTKGEEIKGLLLNQKFAHIRNLVYKNSVPVFYDPNLDTLQYTLNFNLYYDSTLQTVIDLIMNLFFSVGADTIQNITIGESEAGTYSKETLTNITGASYKVNTLAVSLPFTVVAGDQLEITITQTDSTLESKIELGGKK